VVRPAKRDSHSPVDEPPFLGDHEGQLVADCAKVNPALSSSTDTAINIYYTQPLSMFGNCFLGATMTEKEKCDDGWPEVATSISAADYFHTNFHKGARNHAHSQVFMNGQRRQAELEVLDFERW
jgi:hypothetical protein